MLLEAKWRDFSYQLNFWKKENSKDTLKKYLLDEAEKKYNNPYIKFKFKFFIG